MASVALLDDTLVDKIAAGEVVERPSSVVKELVENSLDAGATSIHVEIDNGGKDRIRIVDDGHGMSREDATLAIRRHATSKLRTFEDLLAIGTLGFRGEALPSIASVSRFTLTTRRREDVAGTLVRVEGGGTAEIRDAGSPPGTTLEVADLFFNVPARRKFLRARQTERSQIADVVTRAALAHPRVRFTLVHEGRTLREHLAAPSRYARAKTILQDESLRPIEGEHEGIRLEGGLGPAADARRGSKQLYLFVNGRPVLDPALARIVHFAHGDALEPGRYPSGALFLELDPHEVDVNAHPQKTEVRFADLAMVKNAITHILTQALGTRRWAGAEGDTIRGSAARATTREPSSGPLLRAAERGATEPSGGPGPLGRGASFWRGRLRRGPTAESAPKAPAPVQPSPRPRVSDTEDAFAAALRGSAAAEATASMGAEPVAAAVAGPRADGDGADGCLGALSNGLVLGEHAGALHVLDPRAVWAAHARSVLAETPVPRRRLLFPSRVGAPDDERLLSVLEGLGFELRPLGERTLAVHAAPRFERVEVTGERLAQTAIDALGPSLDGAAARRALVRMFADEAQGLGSLPEAIWSAFLALGADERGRAGTRLSLRDLEEGA